MQTIYSYISHVSSPSYTNLECTGVKYIVKFYFHHYSCGKKQTKQNILFDD